MNDIELARQYADRMYAMDGASRALGITIEIPALGEAVARVDGRRVGKWTNDPLADSEFERDVAVGLGQLLLRVCANGRLEWAEAGRWNKHFEADDDEPGTRTSTGASTRRRGRARRSRAGSGAGMGHTVRLHRCAFPEIPRTSVRPARTALRNGLPPMVNRTQGAASSYLVKSHLSHRTLNRYMSLINRHPA